MAFGLLAFLQVSPKTANILGTLIGLVSTKRVRINGAIDISDTFSQVTAAAFNNYVIMSITYVCFYRTVMAQGYDRKKMPYYGYFQPYCGWISVVFFTCVVGVYGYTTFSPFNIKGFFASYTMVFACIVLFVGWKLLKRTKFIRPSEADLVWERPIVDAYEAAIIAPPVEFWTEMMQLVGFRRQKGGDVQFEEGVVPTRNASVSSAK